MSGLFGGGSRARATDPQVPIPETALRLTTSIQGKPRPIGWGRNRIGSNLIWFGDFTPILVASSTPAPQGGGKGGGRAQQQAPVNYSWNYYVNFLISLCEGPIQSVVAVNTSNGWTTWPSSLIDPGSIEYGIGGIMSLVGPLNYATLIPGTQTQAPWSLLTTFHPDQALAYRGEAMLGFTFMPLGTSTTIPNMSFDVIFGHLGGLAAFPYDAYPDAVVLDFLTNPQYGVPGYTTSLIDDLTEWRTFCGANGLLVSPVISDQIEAASILSELIKATHAAPFMSGGKLRIRPYAEANVTRYGVAFTVDNTPIYDIAPSDFLPGPSGPMPIDVKRAQPKDTINNIRIEYLDRKNSYNPSIIEQRDEARISAYGVERPSDVRSQHFFCVQDIASVAAALQLQREQVSTTYTFNLPREFELLDPMDLITLPLDHYGMGDVHQPVRIIEILENSDYSFTITAEEFLGTATAPAYNRQNTVHNLPDFNVGPGNINPPVLFEMPAAISQGLYVYAAVSGVNMAAWGGCDVWASYDGTTYTWIEQIKGASRMGVTTSVLAANGVNHDLVDFSTLSVDLTMSKGVLGSSSLSDMIAHNTLCLLGTELIGYDLATLTAPNKYDLTPLLRGSYGTAILDHAAGSTFVRIDGTVIRIPYEKARIGHTVTLKFVSFNPYGGGEQDLSVVSPYTYQISGRAVDPEPPPPDGQDDNQNKDFIDAVNSHKEITIVGKANAKSAADVSNLAITSATQSRAFAEMVSTVKASFDQSSARITTDELTIASNQRAFAQYTHDTDATLGNHEGRIRTTENTLVTDETAFANYQRDTNATIGNHEGRIHTSELAIASDETAFANFQRDTNATIGNHEGRIHTSELALGNDEQAFASYQQVVGTRFDKAEGRITVNENSISNAQGVVTALDQSVTSRFKDANARIDSNQQTIATNFQAFSDYQGAVDARFKGNEAKISTHDSAIATNTNAIANHETRVRANEASISHDEQAFSDFQTIGAFAQTKEQVRINGLDISTNTQAVRDVNGRLSGRYTLDIDNSGKIAGFSLINGGGGSSFDIRADVFNIWQAGYPNQPVFTVGSLNGVPQVVIRGDVINDLSTGTNAIANNAITNAASSVGHANSGVATLTVRAGSRVVITAFYSGVDVFTSSSYIAGNLDVTYNDGTHGDIVTSFPINDSLYAGGNNYFPTMVVFTLANVTGGVWTVSAKTYTILLGQVTPFNTGTITILIEEFRK